ncbi:hypothetical protein TNCV_3967291 [Trichonephila clavipes]|nr:hypothetical protein TNCV_3967291 [Trichonephila clavipes]
MTVHSPTENSLAVLNHKILKANSQVQNVKLGDHQTCLSINRLWHELCDMLRRLVEPQLLDIMIVQFRNKKVSNHGSIPITIDCNVVAFIVFEEGFHQPIKRTKHEDAAAISRVRDGDVGPVKMLKKKMEDGEQREKKKRLKEEEKVPERRQRHFILCYRSSSIPTWDLTPGVKKSLKGDLVYGDIVTTQADLVACLHGACTSGDTALASIDPFVGHEILELIPPEISQLKATRSNLLRVSSGQNCIRCCLLNTNVFHGIIYQAAR